MNIFGYFFQKGPIWRTYRQKMGTLTENFGGLTSPPPHSLRSGGPARDKYFKLKKSLNLKIQSFENVSFSH